MTQSSTPWPKLKRDLIAILRGVKPDEVLGIGEELVSAGIDVIEVPLNSPSRSNPSNYWQNHCRHMC